VHGRLTSTPARMDFSTALASPRRAAAQNASEAVTMGGLQPLNRWNASNARSTTFFPIHGSGSTGAAAAAIPTQAIAAVSNLMSPYYGTITTQMSIASHAGAKRCAAERPQSVGALRSPVSPGLAACSGPTGRSAARLLKDYQRSAAQRWSGSSGWLDRSLARRKRRKVCADDLSKC
jgi:hypothetical protein